MSSLKASLMLKTNELGRGVYLWRCGVHGQ